MDFLFFFFLAEGNTEPTVSAFILDTVVSVVIILLKSWTTSSL